MLWAREQVPPRDRRLAVVLSLAVPLILHAAVNWWAYFETWGRASEAFDAFEGDAVAAARWLKRNPPERPAYISTDIYRHPSFALLYGEVPLTELFDWQDPLLRWFDARFAMPMPPAQGATYLLGASAMPDRERLQRLLPVMTPLATIQAPSGRAALEIYQVDKGGPPPRTQGLPGQGLPRLVGYGLTGEARAGGAIEVTLYWLLDDRGDAPAMESPNVLIALEDAQGMIRGAWEGAFPYRYGEWRRGDVIATWHTISLPSEAPPGPYAIRVAMDRAGSPVARLAPGGPAPEFTPPSVIPTEFENGLQLLDIQTRPAIGDPGRAIIDLVWRATRPLETSYTLFVHLLNQSNELVAQADTLPAGGLFPTDAWPPGVPVRDQVEIALPPGAASGRYTLWLGCYNWRTGQRLSIVDAEGQPLTDRIELSIELAP